MNRTNNKQNKDKKKRLKELSKPCKAFKLAVMIAYTPIFKS